MSQCARCGKPINENTSAWTPTMPGELCSVCLTGHEGDWVEPIPDAHPATPRQLVLIAIAEVAAFSAIGWLIARATDDPMIAVISVVISVVIAVAIVISGRRPTT